MKTKEQVVRQLKVVSFSTEEWELVRKYCKENHKYANLKRAARLPIEWTFHDFKEWFDTGYGSGDFVRYGNAIAVVSCQDYNRLRLCAYFDMNDRLIIPEKRFRFTVHPGYSLIVGDELEKYQRLMRNEGYTINYENGALVELEPAKPNQIRRFYHGSTIYVGVVKDVTENGVIMYFGYSEDTLIDGDLVVAECDVLDKVSKDEWKNIDKRIKLQYRCEWDMPHKSLRYYVQNNINKRYFYITDKFTISSATENGGALCDMRRKNCNYFLTYKEALDFLLEIQDIRMKQIKSKAINH